MLNKGKDIQERSYSFALVVTKMARDFPKNPEGFALGGQIIRSATSIPANLFEGSAGVSRKEFIQFVSVSKKSAIETQFWLRFSHDLGLIGKEEYEKTSDECEQLIRIISRIILNSKQ